MKLMIGLLCLSGYIIISTVDCSVYPLVTHPGGIGGIFRGPNSETIIEGPDGSVITSESEGGEIHTATKFEPIVVAESAEFSESADIGSNAIAPFVNAETIDSLQAGRARLPVIESGGDSFSITSAPLLEAVIPATAAPIVASVAPVIAASVPIEITVDDLHIIETEIVDAPVIEPNQSSDLVGPSGSISTRGSSSIISGPASTTISEPARVVAPTITGFPIVASVTIPLQAPSLVGREEAPVALSTPLNPIAVPAAASGLSTTIAPINAASTFVPYASSIAPPFDAKNIDTNWGSTLVPSFISPISNGGLRNSVDISSTLRPYALGEPWNDKVNFQSQYSTASPITDQNQVFNSRITSADPFGGNIVQLSSSNGVIDNSNVDGRIVSTTLGPEQLQTRISSTNIPVQSEGNLQRLLDQALVHNSQLTLNPDNIPSRNIVPPEIGLAPEGTLNLGETVEAFTVPRAPGLASMNDPQNIQRVLYKKLGSLQGPEQFQVFSRVNNVQNELIPVDSRDNFGNEVYPQTIGGNTPLLRDTQPNAYSIYPQSGVGTELQNQGVGSSQIQLVNIPISSVENTSDNAPVEREVYDDSGTEVLWNRYGRRAFGKP